MSLEKGFSLIELMIVVAILGIVAAIAVPNLVESRAAANEASAIAGLRTVGTAQFAFWTTGQDRYANDLAELTATGFLEAPLSTGTRSGYNFVCVGSVASFTATASPASATTGKRHFFIDESMVIRWSNSGPANASSPPLNSGS